MNWTTLGRLFRNLSMNTEQQLGQITSPGAIDKPLHDLYCFLLNLMNFVIFLHSLSFYVLPPMQRITPSNFLTVKISIVPFNFY